MKIAIHIYIKITNISRTEIKSKCYYCFLGTLFKPFVEFAKGSQFSYAIYFEKTYRNCDLLTENTILYLNRMTLYIPVVTCS